MKSAALTTIAVVLLAIGAARAASGPYEAGSPQTPETPIDKLVQAHLAKAGIPAAAPCSDSVFLRRVYLDVIGTLPTEQEAREFLMRKDANRRSALIDRLLAREEFADYQAMRWCDLLRVKAEFPINLWPNAAQAYHRWVRTSIHENKPCDVFARELLTASGSNFRAPPVNFYRAMQNRTPQGIAQTVALTFLGERADKWPREKIAGLAAFFSQVGYKYTDEWKEEIVYFDFTKSAAAATQPAPVFPDGTTAKIAAGADPREAFADWLTSPKNAAFAKVAVNRVWCWLLGRGIVHEPDDWRGDNPPSHPELLEYLAKELVAAKFDLKHIYRLILNSRTYQLSFIAADKRPEAAAHFASYPVRRLEAEVLIDALCQVTGTTEAYTSPIPEPFTYIPEAQRTICLADGSITSTFLDLFGRSPRDTGLDSERNLKPTAAQRLHMLNSSHIQRKIEQGKRLPALLQTKGGQTEVVKAIYLTILSRFPTDEELKTVSEYPSGRGGRNREFAIDLMWVLTNSHEFLYKH